MSLALEADQGNRGFRGVERLLCSICAPSSRGRKGRRGLWRGTKGVAIEKTAGYPSYGNFAWVRDPDGNKIELWEPSKE